MDNAKEITAAYRGASVLVTGAGGFIGTHLCRYLSRLGAEVTGTYLSTLPKGDNAQWVCVDLTDRDAARDLISNTHPDFIFHLASRVDGRRELDAVQPTFENILTGTLNLLTAVQQAGGCKRLVISNSQEEPERGDPYAAPCSPYAAAKFAAGAYARMFHALYGLPMVIARVFMVYGPEQKDLNKLVPYSILKALVGEAPELTSGLRKVDWIYVEDLVEGMLQLGSKPGLEGETIDLGSGRFSSVKAVVEEILNQIDPTIEAHFGAITDRAMEQERLANTRETESKLGWQAKVDLAEGLARTIAWYRNNKED